MHGHDCRLPKSALGWKHFIRVRARNCSATSRPRSPKFTTVGQWYWGGRWRSLANSDLSKRFASNLSTPSSAVEARLLAMNIAAEDPERQRLPAGWQSPIRTASPALLVRRYLPARLPSSRRLRATCVAHRLGHIALRLFGVGSSGDYRRHRRKTLSSTESGSVLICRRGEGRFREVLRLVAAVEASAAGRSRSLIRSKIFAEYSILRRSICCKRFSGDTRCPVMADLIKQSEPGDRMKKSQNGNWRKPNRALNSKILSMRSIL